MNTLFLKFWVDDDDFCCFAQQGSFRRELRLADSAKAIRRDFEQIYNAIENKTHSEEAQVRAKIAALSVQLLQPLLQPLRQCQLVRILPDKPLLRAAFDLLEFDGVPLYLQRKVCYQWAAGDGEDQPHLPLESALLLADLTADPEKACQTVAEQFAAADYAEVDDDSLQAIKDAAAEVDVLVVSAHGDLQADNSGSMELGEKTLTAKTIGALEQWLVYFDSCGQMNRSFLNAFQDESDVQFYLAPIISNDAGDSSTRTMVWFFGDLLRHGDPLQALFDTRCKLTKYYTEKSKQSWLTRLNKAFAFRLYEFVGE